MKFLIQEENGKVIEITQKKLEAIAKSEAPIRQTKKYMQRKIEDCKKNFSGTLEERYNFEIEYWRHIVLYAQDMLEFLEETMELRKQQPDLFDW